MSYDLIETATAEGRPCFLYLFAEGAQVWRFTSRASAWMSPAGAIAGETGDLIWVASAVSHGAILQSDHDPAIAGHLDAEESGGGHFSGNFPFATQRDLRRRVFRIRLAIGLQGEQAITPAMRKDQFIFPRQHAIKRDATGEGFGKGLDRVVEHAHVVELVHRLT